ncbi:unnamed protein product [Ceratitis capitata]|uniref:(Mediterranean fruit fly) hypothetical protein n=1 Tax=Ceratitis capitata TaxID=7213 RepID=A0A811V5N4_CERCA|nr:unnamed protein product [Ceratitis capitata]
MEHLNPSDDENGLIGYINELIGELRTAKQNLEDVYAAPGESSNNSPNVHSSTKEREDKYHTDSPTLERSGCDTMMAK